jgi:hypothetical protein
MNTYRWPIVVLAVLILVGGIVLLWKDNLGGETKNPDQLSSTTPPVVSPLPAASPTPSTSVLPYGKVTLRVGETAKFSFNSITPLGITDESRCAEGVTCIWAGTLKAEIVIVSGMGTSTETIELGNFITTEAEKITFLEAVPYPQEGKKISQNDYRLTFELAPREGEAHITPTPQPKKKACYTGGCSGQICSDQSDMVSTCEFRAEYACYKTATCERQTSGACGWTETPELQACLSNPPSL